VDGSGDGLGSFLFACLSLALRVPVPWIECCALELYSIYLSQNTTKLTKLILLGGNQSKRPGITQEMC